MKLHGKVLVCLIISNFVLAILVFNGQYENKIPPQTKIFWLDWPKMDSAQTNELGEIYKWDYKFGFREDGVMVWCKTNLVITRNTND